MDSSSSEADLIEQLADEFASRQRRGEHPTLEEYMERYPDLASEIRDIFPALVMMEQVVPAASDLKESQRTVDAPDRVRLEQIEDYRVLREIGRGGMGVVYEAEQESLGRRVALKVLLNEMSASARSMQRFQREARAAARMHHTNIVPVFEVGQDGDTAFYAMQLIQGQGLDLVIDDLKRLRKEHSSRSGVKAPVAPSSGAAPSIADSLARGKFHQENLAVHMQADPAQSDQEPALTFTETVDHKLSSTVSATLPGESEISTAESNRSRFHWSVAQIGMQTAGALAYAHARGIIHRDIKPSNLILDADGVVWVTDFGLAKTDDEGMTHTGDILGTMRYMSPERFRGQCDVRADVYSLGLTLYELLVLKPAFESPDRLKLIEMVRQSEPPTPRSIDPRIPRDLETIVLKSIDKDPKRRYQSADELSEDLRRYIDDEPILARRISLPERLMRWSRRNKAVAASLTIVALLLITAAVGSTIAAGYFWAAEEKQRELARRNEQLAIEARVERDKAKAAKQHEAEQRIEAERQRQRAEYGSYISQVRLAAANLDRGNGMVARQELLSTQSEHRDWEWGYLVGLAWPPEIAVDPDNILVPQPDHSVAEFWAAARARVIKKFDRGRYPPISASPEFSSNSTSTKMATAMVDGSLHLWNLRTGEQLASFPGRGSTVLATAFSHNDKRLAAGDAGGDLVLFDTDSNTMLWREQLSGQAISGIWFSPDDTRLVAASVDGALLVRDTRSGRLLRAVSEHPTAVQSLRYLPDAKGGLTASRDGSIRVWELETGQPIGPPEFVSPHGSLASSVVEISPDGRQVAVGYIDGSIILWDRETHEKSNLFKGNDQINDLVFSGDGSCLFVAEGEQLVRVLDTAGGELNAFPSTMKQHAEIAVSPDGTRIATSSNDGITVWAPVLSETDERRMLGNAHDDLVLQAAFRRDGARIVTASYDKTSKVWDSVTQELVTEFRGHNRELLKAEFSPDGKCVASVDCRGTVRVWDAETGEEISSVAADSKAFFDAASFRRGLRGLITEYSAVFSSNPFAPSGDRLVVNDGKEMVVVEYPYGRRLLTLEENPVIGWPVIDPHGKRVATITATLNEVHLWDLKTGKKLHKLVGHQEQAYWAEFSADGLRLVTSSMDGTAIVWDVVTGKELVRLDHGENVKTARFSPKGERIATASNGTTAKIWDASTGEHLSTFDNHTDSLTNVEFSPDGMRVLTTAVDKSLRVWDPTEFDARELVQFTQDSKLVYGTWSPDGRQILTCWSDGSVHLLQAFPWNESVEDSMSMNERVRLWRQGRSVP